MKKLLALFVVVLGFSAVSFGQNAIATAVTNATIISPISIAKKNATSDLNFGNIISDLVGGTVTVVPAGTRTATGLTLPTAQPGTVGAAIFTVTGLANATYGITLPASAITLTGPASATMSVGTFVSNPAAGMSGGLLNGSGTQDISVGAILTVGPSQAAGLYTNAAGLSVTVNYN